MHLSAIFLLLLALNQTLAVELNKAELDKLYPNTPTAQADVLELNLTGRNYDTIATGTFAAFTKVERIFLGRNQLATQSFTLLNVPSLRTLVVSRNGIQNLNFDSGDSNKLKTLVTLDLSSNKIETLAVNYPDYAPELSTVVLANNLISSLKADQFTSAKFFGIDLSGNKISAIAAGAFKTPDLAYLKLERNQLTGFPSSVFAGPQLKLEQLDLSSNTIAAFPTDAVNALTGLKGLYLSQNRISELRGDFLGSNTKLQTLKLSGNRIGLLELDAINSASRCFTELDLYGNPITDGISVNSDGLSSACLKVTCKQSNTTSGTCVYRPSNSASGRCFLGTGSLWLLLTLLGSYFAKH